MFAVSVIAALFRAFRQRHPVRHDPRRTVAQVLGVHRELALVVHEPGTAKLAIAVEQHGLERLRQALAYLCPVEQTHAILFRHLAQ